MLLRGTTFEWQYEDPPGSGIFVPLFPAETGPTLDVTVTGTYKPIADFAGVCQSGRPTLYWVCTYFPVDKFQSRSLGSLRRRQRRFFGIRSYAGRRRSYGRWPDLFVSYHATQLDAENGSFRCRLLREREPIRRRCLGACGERGEQLLRVVAQPLESVTVPLPVLARLRFACRTTRLRTVSRSSTWRLWSRWSLAGWTRSSSTFGSTGTLGKRRPRVTPRWCRRTFRRRSPRPGPTWTFRTPDALGAGGGGNASSTSPK